MNSSSMKWVVRPLVPEEVYTDREEFLEYFYKTALLAGTRRTMSTVLLGQRRMGKTEIFKRVVNRLFFSQNPKHPEAVVPVYFSFPETVILTVRRRELNSGKIVLRCASVQQNFYKFGQNSQKLQKTLGN